MALRNAFELIATDAKLELVRVLLASVDSKLALNTDGRIKVSTMPGLYTLQASNITASGQTHYVNVESTSNVMVMCKANPTVAGHNVTFEGSLDSSDGVDGTWFTLQAVRSNANTIETSTGVLAATPAYSWELSVNALKWFRIRCTAHTSGTMQWQIQEGSYATEPIPAIQAHEVTVSSSVSIGNVTPTLYADSTTNLAAAAVFTGTSRDGGSTLSFQRFVARSFADQIGTLTIEDSTNNTTWRQVASVTTVANIGSTLEVAVVARYNRVKFTCGGTGTGALRVTSAYHRV